MVPINLCAVSLTLFLSYQVRYGILHAGQYGAPQTRRRVIFIAAKRGVPLPDLPRPTHLTPDAKVLHITLENGDRFCVNKTGKQTAPLGAITVQDAISDLPAWEW